MGDGQLGQGLVQVSARIGYVLPPPCPAQSPDSRRPSGLLHPLRKPQVNDTTSHSRHFADHGQAGFCLDPCQAGAPGDSPVTSSGSPPCCAHSQRRCSSIARRTATAPSNPRLAPRPTGPACRSTLPQNVRTSGAVAPKLTGTRSLTKCKIPIERGLTTSLQAGSWSYTPTLDQNSRRTLAPALGSWSIHQCPSRGRTATLPPAFSAAQRALRSPPV